MTIRNMKREDKDVCLKMVHEFYSSPAVDHAVPTDILEQTYNDALDPTMPLRGIVIEENGQVLGFGYITSFYACEVGGISIMLEELFVNEHARGKGIGQYFFDWVQKEYPQAKRFRLEVTKENTRAIQLYQRMGFEEISYYQMIKDI